MKYPVRIKYRGHSLAVIYAKNKNYPYYRLAYRVNGKRQMRSFHDYSGARKFASTLIRQLAQGSQVAALTAAQARDAIAAMQRLQTLYEVTGRRVSLLAGISEYAESVTTLGKHSLAQAVEGYLTTVASLKRMDLGQAVEQFIEDRKQRTVAADGRRPQLSPEHHYNTAIWVREFAATFPGHVVSDLTKDFLNTYMAKHSKAAPKTRNERRGLLKMFLRWCVERDYIPPTHRLFEASGLKHETADPEEIECYTARELRAILERATKLPEPPEEGQDPKADYRELLPFLSLASLAGMREKEITRLTWQDVFRVPGHIEVGALKAKTRSRRLIEICPALAQWLEPYRVRSGPIWSKSYDRFHEMFGELREELKIPNRRNGMRHSFVSAHYAAHSDEGLTAAQAGNSPAIVHRNYKGLMTKKDGEAWFNSAASRRRRSPSTLARGFPVRPRAFCCPKTRRFAPSKIIAEIRTISLARFDWRGLV